MGEIIMTTHTTCYLMQQEPELWVTKTHPTAAELLRSITLLVEERGSAKEWMEWFEEHQVISSLVSRLESEFRGYGSGSALLCGSPSEELKTCSSTWQLIFSRVELLCNIGI